MIDFFKCFFQRCRQFIVTGWLLALLLPAALSVQAGETILRYKAPGADKVILVWGINDWQKIANPPPGTYFKGKKMRTPMTRNGDEFVLKLAIDSGTGINYCFIVEEIKGPFHIHTEYWDLNAGAELKNYYSIAGNHTELEHHIPAFRESQDNIELNKYGGFLFWSLLLLNVALFIRRKYYSKTSAGLFSKTACFFAMASGLMIGLWLIRIYTSQALFNLAIDPGSFPSFIGIGWSDLLYATILSLLFGTLFAISKRTRTLVLWLFGIMMLLSVLIVYLNTMIISLLGHPFNYQWLYYADFLQSMDSVKAVAANISIAYILAAVFLMLIIVLLCMLLYRIIVYKSKYVFIGLPLFITASIVCGNLWPSDENKTVNPVLYFVKSMLNHESDLFDKKYAGNNDFIVKNPETVSPAFKDKIAKAGIKNVLFFVLESTPAEYVAPYSKTIKATPFLDSIQQQGAVFNNIYAHIPATNKSMFAFLCSIYPEISFKSITKEAPDIALPSIPSELNRQGYRTAFFNSGDNSFQNAIGFLKGRGFGHIEDYKDNSCKTTVFTDSRYAKDELDGIDDSCLSVKFFNWLGNGHEQPFFSMMWTFQTHYPYFTSGEGINYKTGNPMLEKYLNGLHRADETLRQLVEGLKARHLFDSTLIVVCGDHGEAFGRHGQTTHASHVFEENVHVPLLFINPVLFNGERLPVRGGITDIAPTILSILQQKSPDIWQGENLFSSTRRKRVYFFTPYGDYQFGMQEGNFKYIFNATNTVYELYDLSKDPGETNNIAASNPAYVKEADAHLKGWMYYQSQFWNNLMKNYSSTKH